MSSRTSRAMFVLTFLLYGGLNHNVFLDLCLLRLVWVFVFAGSYLSWVVKLLCFKSNTRLSCSTQAFRVFSDKDVKL